MLRETRLFHWHASMGALVVLTAGCGIDSEPAMMMEASYDEPAELLELSGSEAAKLAALGFAQPVLAARAGDRSLAVVFAEKPTDIPPLLEKLLMSEVPDCAPEGAVVCCDPDTGTSVLNTVQGWIRLGEQCAPSIPGDGRTVDDPDEPGAHYIRVDPELSQALEERFGIDYPFMQLANPDGSPRMLVNGPWQSGDLWLLPPIMQHSGVQPTVQTIPASHRRPTPPGGCVSSVDYCKKEPTKRCRKTWLHWYYEDDSGGQWCEGGTCTC